jgi:hypothetical protein
MSACNYGAQGVGTPTMAGPATFSNYGTCASAAGCGAPAGSGAATAASRTQMLSAMATNGTLTYGSLGRDACGLAAGLPSGTGWGGERAAMNPAMGPRMAPELGNIRISGAPSDAGLDSAAVLYDWRRDAWRYQPGMVYREWTDRQRAAAGINDPWGNQTARQFAVDASQGWAGLVNLSKVATAGVANSPTAAALNYAGQPLASQAACAPQPGQASLFQGGCTPSPQAYGAYKQYGMEPDFFRATPYAVAYSSPVANPQAFAVSATLPNPATPQACVSRVS